MLTMDQTYVHGRDRETAQMIMAACRSAGVDRMVVRTTDSGFIVPNVVWDEVERMNAPAWAAEEAVF
jgi:hypothetical protein